MTPTCPKCGEAANRVEMRVLVLKRVWVERVAGIECPACGASAMTKPGLAKVNRLIEASQELFGRVDEVWEPVAEITRVFADSPA